jgi:predicted nicotinamide N-methyase
LITSSETLRVGDVELTVERPSEPEALLDEEAFANDEFMPYWAELWPAGLALAEALPDDLAGVRVVELGCGLGVPSLVAAARGATVTAVDWAADAIALLRENAARNGLELEAVRADWRSFE